VKVDNVAVKSLKTEEEYVLHAADRIGYLQKLAAIVPIFSALVRNSTLGLEYRETEVTRI